MYENLSSNLEKIILKQRSDFSLSKFACNDGDALRRNNDEGSSVLRAPFYKDADKIVNCPYFSRYADKTQVFSLRYDDDFTRRSLHVQLVSRIARNIGKALNLNSDLIESIALGHDIGHTPFGHAGEKALDKVLYKNCGKRFFHNLQSVRVLDKIFNYNVTLQTLDGILTHNGERLENVYAPVPLKSFAEFDETLKRCATDTEFMFSLSPATLEGCVVRLSDVIAYIGKDRQDAERAKIVKEDQFSDGEIGGFNAEIINNLTVNAVENSYGKNYIKLDEKHFCGLKRAMEENYSKIYESPAALASLSGVLEPMTEKIFNAMLQDLKNKKRNSPIFVHHVDFVKKSHYKRYFDYEKEDPNIIVADFIASMTDDYFIALYKKLFPDSELNINYRGYFD